MNLCSNDCLATKAIRHWPAATQAPNPIPDIPSTKGVHIDPFEQSHPKRHTERVLRFQLHFFLPQFKIRSRNRGGRIIHLSPNTQTGPMNENMSYSSFCFFWHIFHSATAVCFLLCSITPCHQNIYTAIYAEETVQHKLVLKLQAIFCCWSCKVIDIKTRFNFEPFSLTTNFDIG